MEKFLRPPPPPKIPAPLHALENRWEPLEKIGYQGAGVGTAYHALGRALPRREETTQATTPEEKHPQERIST